MKELLEILYLLFGVSKDSNEDDLKKSYRRIATQFHPDKHKEIDPNIFIAMTKGYEILLNEIKNEDSSNNGEKGQKNKEKFDSTNLTETQIYEFAKLKLLDTFKNIMSQGNLTSTIDTDIFKRVNVLFNEETKHLNTSNATIRKDNEILRSIRNGIKSSKEDEVGFKNVINNMIKKRRRMIKENKNKIKINEVALNLLKEYSFNPYELI